MGDRYTKSDEDEKILYNDAINLYGWAVSQYLKCEKIKFDKNVKLEGILNSQDDFDIVYCIECGVLYPNSKKDKTKKLPFCHQK